VVGQFGDFIEKERAFTGCLESTNAGALRIRKCAGFGAEQLSFDQRIGDGRAINSDKRLFGAIAVVVYGVSDKLLADAAVTRSA